jgi:hypothetical protein
VRSFRSATVALAFALVLFVRDGVLLLGTLRGKRELGG